MNTKARQQGVAVITAMVIVAIAVVLATDRLWYASIDKRRTENLLGADQAFEYILGAEDWVAHILRRDEREYDSNLDSWAEDTVILPIEGGQITGHITDNQALFNINNIVDQQGSVNIQWLDRLRRLFVILEQDPTVVDRIADWIDTDIEPIGFNGAEDDYYLRKVPAYRTPNRPLRSISELRRVEGMTPELFTRLAPYITALPTYTQVNINFAPPEVLLAIGDAVTDSDIGRIMEAREDGQLISGESLAAFLQSLQGSFPAEMLSVNSSYFLLLTRVVVGSAGMTMYSILHRDSISGDTLVLQRSAGFL
ncbi:MAG: type II secretion system minor pseudopilin GspK [Gammaproteobacteria bacterium]